MVLILRSWTALSTDSSRIDETGEAITTAVTLVEKDCRNLRTASESLTQRPHITTLRMETTSSFMRVRTNSINVISAWRLVSREHSPLFMMRTYSVYCKGGTSRILSRGRESSQWMVATTLKR